ncbi:MAG: hypothetical protein RLZZ628_493 [Bacteroidota bacterium]|jgi:hypothetical protein
MIFKTADNLSVKRVEKRLESSFTIKARIIPSRKRCQKDRLDVDFLDDAGSHELHEFSQIRNFSFVKIRVIRGYPHHLKNLRSICHV